MNALLAVAFERFGVVLLGLANSFWVAAAAAVLVWVTLRFVWRGNAATRHAAWWAVLAVVVVMPFAPRWIPEPTQPVMAPAVITPAEATPLPVFIAEPVELVPAAAAPVEVPGGGWIAWALAAWTLVFLYRMARIGHSYLFLRGIKLRANDASDEVQARFDAWQTRRTVRLLISSEIASPMAVGFLRPAVILPEALLAELSDAELDHVLLHERAHLVRWDDWTNLVARIAGAVLGLHPVAAWSLKQLAREREQSCDDWVVAHTGQARPYAASLARLFELAQTRRGVEVLASGMAGRGSHLGDRIEGLLARGRTFVPHMSMEAIAIGTVILVALVIFGAQSPQWIAFAQERVAPVAPIAPLPPTAPQAPVAPLPAQNLASEQFRIDFERSFAEVTRQVRDIELPLRELARNPAVGEAEIARAIKQVRDAEEQLHLLAQNQPRREGEMRGAEVEIEKAREELERLSAKYTQAHPDVVRLRREMADLEKLRTAPQLLAQNQPEQDFLRSQIRELEAQVDRMKQLAQDQPQREAEIRAMQEQIRAREAEIKAQAIAFNAQLRNGKLILDDSGKPFLTELAEAGYKDLPVDTIIKLAQGGVTGAYMRELKEAGFGDMKIDEIIEAAQGGVSGRDLKAAREYNPKLTLKQIIELKQGGALE